MPGEWRDNSGDQAPGEIPSTGELPASLAVFGTELRKFMAENRIPGGALGVAKDRDVLVERGYGYRDQDRSARVTPDTLFRLASHSKSFTRAAIRSLLATDRLDRSRPVFDLLGYDPLPGETYNRRLDDVTVTHLLDHRGGWDRDESFDPLFSQLDIALERGWAEPPRERQLVRYMLSEPLQFDPESRSAYSNFGYLVLGRVVEAVTGRAFREFLGAEILGPADVTDVHRGRSLPADRHDRETWYFDGRSCRTVAEMKPLELVRCPDGGFHQEATGGAGGCVATVGAFLGFMSRYWLDPGGVARRDADVDVQRGPAGDVHPRPADPGRRRRRSVQPARVRAQLSRRVRNAPARHRSRLRVADVTGPAQNWDVPHD